MKNGLVCVRSVPGVGSEGQWVNKNRLDRSNFYFYEIRFRHYPIFYDDYLGTNRTVK